MKKNFFKIVSVFALVSVLFFACKKDKVEETCGTTLVKEAEAFEAKALAFEEKITANPLLYTQTECSALRVEAVNLVAKVKSCPQTSNETALIAELDALVAEFDCPSISFGD